MDQRKTATKSMGALLIRGVAAFLVLAVISLASVSWWLTAPLESPQLNRLEAAPQNIPSTLPAQVAPLPTWPIEPLDGQEAKGRLLDVLDVVLMRLEAVAGYTATLKKQERIDGKLLPEQTLVIKVRNQPFAFYGRFLAPKKGKEVVYAEGHNDNHVIAHNGDWTRKLIPRLAVPPSSPLALKDSRHPVTEAGLVFLTRRLIGFRKLDFEDPEAGSTLDWAPGPDGKLWPRSIHTHPHPTPERPFARIEVLYDPESLIPRQITNFDWPTDGQGGDLPLAERYLYLDLDLDAILTDTDFDPANPDYAFHRF